MRSTRFWLALILLILVLLVVAGMSMTGNKSTRDHSTNVTPTPLSTPFPNLVLTLTADRLAKPEMSSPPTQADKGAEYYWFVCLPCHGDKGQGLTDEWREVFGPEEMNCWQSNCHGKRHPPDGFELPHRVPPVLGPNALARFTNAAELHHVISTAMPWWGPRYLTQEAGWNVTAYLLREQGVLPAGVTLDAGNAPIFRLRTLAPSTAEERPITWIVIGLLGAAVLIFFWQMTRRDQS